MASATALKGAGGAGQRVFMCRLKPVFTLCFVFLSTLLVAKATGLSRLETSGVSGTGENTKREKRRKTEMRAKQLQLIEKEQH